MIPERAVFLDSMGRLRTQSLFYEFKTEGYTPIFTLKEEDWTDPDGNDLISLRRIYIESLDPTEYLFSQRAFGSWKHWTRLRTLNWFSPFYDEWKVELDARLRSLGTRALLELSQGTALASNPAAARYLANGEYWHKSGPKRGRPTREEVEGERKRIAEFKEELADDANRIGLNS